MCLSIVTYYTMEGLHMKKEVTAVGNYRPFADRYVYDGCKRVGVP